jgi:hypothetical protein
MDCFKGITFALPSLMLRISGKLILAIGEVLEVKLLLGIISVFVIFNYSFRVTTEQQYRGSTLDRP